MCGIVIGSGQDWTEKRTKKYLELIKHRGPDNTGFYNNLNVYIGHVRLSIIDTNEASNQPFFFENYVVSYNGEMFNYIEEREILREKGYAFDTESDTEVIIKMFKEYGLNFINRVNGMFVISIYDTESKKIFIWRDRFGIKPFYYSLYDDSFVGCSEIKPILLDKNFNIKWNKHILASFIRENIINYSDETFYEGIMQLEPGSFIEYNALKNKIKTEKYYTLKRKQKTNFNEIKSLLSDSVKLRMRSDVGYSSALSGGVDSTLITRLMQENNNGKGIDVFSMLRDSADDFDTEYSLKYKNIFTNNQYTRVTPNKDRLLSILDEVFYYQEEPFQGPSMVLQFLMYRLMKEAGIKVVLEGQGGDEVFIGYERYLFSDNLVKFFLKGGIKRISNQTRLSKSISAFYWFYFRYPIIRKLKNIRTFGLKTNHLLKRYINSNYLKDSCSDLKKGELRINEITKFQLRRLLNYGDKSSMANSVEVRLPFLDYRVIEGALSIDHDALIKDYWSKYLLREFLDDFGLKDFAWRKNKNGFDTSDDSWEIVKFYPKASSVEDFFKINIEKIKDRRLVWNLVNIRALEKIYDISI